MQLFVLCLKKQGMDPTVLANFRPISNLSFITKILEKTVLDQLQTFLADNLIFEVFQSGFRKYHSTETALLKVFNDILLTCDSGNYAVLVLLDLTAAFDTVDHAVLINRLERCAGIAGSALEWFKSYLTVRPGSIDPMTAVVQRVKAFCVLLSFLFHDTTRLNGRLFLIYFISLFHLTP